MSVIIYNGHIKQCRNPSGLSNKVSWLLKESKRDVDKILTICDEQMLFCNNKHRLDTIISWKTAECCALECVKYKASNLRELYKIKSVQGQKMQDSLTKLDKETK